MEPDVAKSRTHITYDLAPGRIELGIKPRHLNQAPIVEALIDFRITPRGDLEPKIFASVADRIREEFPTSKTLFSFEGRINLTKGDPVPEVVSPKRLRGYRYETQDGLSIAQFREDGFTFNRLRPYTSWQDMLPRALQLWQMYSELARPDSVDRLAVRYINQLLLPRSADGLQKFLKSTPNVPQDLPNELTHFLTRIVLHDKPSGAYVNVIQTLDKSMNPDLIALILDIDVYRQGAFTPQDIAPTFDGLHDVKNQVFFGSITEDAVRLFE